MSTWSLIITISGTPTDITAAVDVPSIRRTLRLHSEMRPNSSYCEFRCAFSSSLLGQLLGATVPVYCAITKDAAAYFTGIISPNYECTLRNGAKFIQIKVEDYRLKLLGKTIITTQTWAGYAVCDPATPASSLVHAIATAAGVTLAGGLPTIATTIPYVCVLPDDGMSWDSLLGDLLFEYGYVSYFTAAGTLAIVEVINTGDVTTTSTLSSGPTGNIRGEPLIRKTQERYDDVRVAFRTVELQTGLTLFEDNSGQDSAHPHCLITLAPTGDADGKDYYPLGDDIAEVFTDWKSPDGKQIVIATSAAMDVSLGAGISVSRALTNYYRRCSFGYRNTSGVSSAITKLRITGNAYVLTSEGVARSSDSGEQLLEYPAKHLYSSAVAQALAQRIRQYYKYSDLGISIHSDEELALGEYVLVTDALYAGISVPARVIEITTAEPSSIASYFLEAVEDYAAVSLAEELYNPVSYPQPTIQSITGSIDTPPEDGQSGDIYTNVVTGNQWYHDGASWLPTTVHPNAVGAAELSPGALSLGDAETYLELYLPCDEGVGLAGNAIHDLSPNALDGVIVGAVAWEYGPFGPVLHLDPGEYVSVPHNAALNIVGDLTILAWVKLDVGSVLHIVVSKCASGGTTNNPFTFYTVAEATPRLYLRRSDAVNSELEISTGTVSIGVWHQVGVVVQSNVCTFWIDGIAAGSSSFTTVILPTGNTEPVLIGQRADGQDFDGSIAKVRIFSAALTKGAIKNYFTNPSVSARSLPHVLAPDAVTAESIDPTSFLMLDETGLGGVWSCEEGSGSIVHDGSGLANHLTLAAGTWGTGGFGGYLGFGGSGAQYAVTAGNVTPAASSSLVFWMKYDASGGGATYRLPVRWENVFQPLITTATGYFSVDVWNGATYSNKATTWQPDSAWHQVAIVATATQLQVYVDASLILSTSVTFAPAAGTIRLSAPTHTFKGFLKGVRAYQKALALREVRYLFQNPGGRIPVFEDAVLMTKPDSVTAALLKVDSFLHLNDETALKAHWSFEDGPTIGGATGTVVTEHTAGVHGTISNEAHFAWVPGKLGGYALSLTNNAGRVTFPAPSNYYGALEDVTFCVWVKVGSLGAGSTHVLSVGEGSGRCWIAYNLSGIAYLNSNFGAGKDYWLSSAVNINDGAWHFVVGRFDRDGYEDIWIDGVYKAQLSIAAGSAVSWDLAASLYVNKEISQGIFSVNQVRIYNRLLQDHEIRHLYLIPRGNIQTMVDINHIAATVVSSMISKVREYITVDSSLGFLTATYDLTSSPVLGDQRAYLDQDELTFGYFTGAAWENTITLGGPTQALEWYNQDTKLGYGLGAADELSIEWDSDPSGLASWPSGWAAGPGITLRSDQYITFAETDGAKAIGVMDLNAEVFRWKGHLEHGTRGREYVAGSAGLYTYHEVAGLTSQNVNNVGALKITLPFSWINTMLSIEVTGFDYNIAPRGAWTLLIGGYPEIGSTAWQYETALLWGRPDFSRVRFGHDGTKCCIVLGETTSDWDYPKVVVTRVLTGYSSANSAWQTGWALAFTADLAGITFSGDFTVARTASNYIIDPYGLQHAPTTGYSVTLGDDLLFGYANPYLQWEGNTLNLANSADVIPIVAIRGKTTYSARLDLYESGDATVGISLNAGGESYIANPGASLAIGEDLTDPTTTLHVKGAIQASGAARALYSYGVGQYGDANTEFAEIEHESNYFLLRSGATGTGTVRPFGWYLGPDQQMVLNTTGLGLGIGASTKLHAVGAIQSSGAGTAVYSYGVGIYGAGDSEYVAMSHASSEALFSSSKTGTGTARPFVWRADGTERMRLATDGTMTVTKTGGVITLDSATVAAKYTVDATHYGLFEVSDSAGNRGVYFGWGDGASYIDLALDEADHLKISGGGVKFAGGGALYGWGDTTNFHIGYNFYYDVGASDWKYQKTDEACLMAFSDDGTMALHNAASGTAGTAITWTKRFDFSTVYLKMGGAASASNISCGIQMATDAEITWDEANDRFYFNKSVQFAKGRTGTYNRNDSSSRTEDYVYAALTPYLPPNVAVPCCGTFKTGVGTYRIAYLVWVTATSTLYFNACSDGGVIGAWSAASGSGSTFWTEAVFAF